MTQIRPAAVAGSFYPGQAATLTRDLAHYLASAPATARAHHRFAGSVSG